MIGWGNGVGHELGCASSLGFIHELQSMFATELLDMGSHSGIIILSTT